MEYNEALNYENTSAAVLINDLFAFIDKFYDRSRVQVLKTFTNNRLTNWRQHIPGGQRKNFVRDALVSTDDVKDSTSIFKRNNLPMLAQFAKAAVKKYCSNSV